jgi:hypothetical protein
MTRLSPILSITSRKDRHAVHDTARQAGGTVGAQWQKSRRELHTITRHHLIGG